MIPLALTASTIIAIIASAYYPTIVTVNVTGSDLAVFNTVTPQTINFVRGTQGSQDLGVIFNVTQINDKFNASGALAYRIILFDTSQYQNDFSTLYLNVTATPKNATGHAITLSNDCWQLLSLTQAEVILEPHWGGGNTVEFTEISAVAYWSAYNEGGEDSADLTLVLDVEQAGPGD